jgi:hypothetical protein
MLRQESVNYKYHDYLYKYHIPIFGYGVALSGGFAGVFVG